MSALPTTITKPERVPVASAAKPVTTGGLSTLKPIKATESLSKARRAEFKPTAPMPAEAPARELKPGAQLFRCLHNIYPQYAAWQTACQARAKPGVGCTCTTKHDPVSSRGSVPELDSQGAA